MLFMFPLSMTVVPFGDTESELRLSEQAGDRPASLGLSLGLCPGLIQILSKTLEQFQGLHSRTGNLSSSSSVPAAARPQAWAEPPEECVKHGS